MNAVAFLKLQREWYEKLKDSGFEDAEFLTRTGNLILSPSADTRHRSVAKQDLASLLGREEYYENLSRMSCSVEDPEESWVLFLRSEGLGFKEIEVAMKELGYKMNRVKAWKIIRKYDSKARASCE